MKINFDNYKIKWKERSGFKKLCLWYDLSQKTMIYSKLTSNSQRCEICSNKDSRITSNVFLVKEDLLKNSIWTYTVTISQSLLQKLILATTMQVTFKLAWCEFVFLQILLTERLIRFYFNVDKLFSSCCKLNYHH